MPCRRATLPLVGCLHSLIWKHGSCMSATSPRERDSFSVSQQPPIWDPPSHYSMPSTLQWWKGIFKLGDGGAALEYVMCKYELLIKIACWERYIQWFLGIICTLCTPAAVSAQYSAGNIVKPHYSRSILTGIQTVHLNSISGQRVDFMFFWINWIRIIALRENNQID